MCKCEVCQQKLWTFFQVTLGIISSFLDFFKGPFLGPLVIIVHCYWSCLSYFGCQDFDYFFRSKLCLEVFLTTNLTLLGLKLLKKYWKLSFHLFYFQTLKDCFTYQNYWSAFRKNDWSGSYLLKIVFYLKKLM